jgi:uncharacterized protein YjbI with pentapeptide repeats
MITSPTLRVLNLSSNSISGELPLLAGSCTVLDLSNNQFKGNLSLSTKWASDLEFIDLSRNQLSGSIPDTTSQFLRLNHLNLSHNTLTGAIPQSAVQYPKLTVLDLSSNRFDGVVPTAVFTSSILQEIYLQDNLLAGEISFSPPATIKTNMRAVDISGNHFTGSFPDGFTSLTGLSLLDISSNNFSGPIPPSISNLSSLTSLDISRNNLNGSLPSSLPDSLLSFNASYNDLSGVVPVNLRKFPESSFHPGNLNLELPPGSPGSTNASNASGQKHLTSGAIIGIIAACIGFALIMLLAVVFCFKNSSGETDPEMVYDKHLQKRDAHDMKKGGNVVISADDLRRGSTSEAVLSQEEKLAVMGPPISSGLSPAKHSRMSWSPESGDSLARLEAKSPDRLAGELHFLDETITLTPEELSRAPAEVLGRSSHGTSYRATLENGVFLTVKWLREGVAKPKKEFAKEARKFANIRHPNVVGLRGYYWGPTQHEKLILSDYVSPGSLASFLYGMLVTNCVLFLFFFFLFLMLV